MKTQYCKQYWSLLAGIGLAAATLVNCKSEPAPCPDCKCDCKCESAECNCSSCGGGGSGGSAGGGTGAIPPTGDYGVIYKKCTPGGCSQTLLDASPVASPCLRSSTSCAIDNHCRADLVKQCITGAKTKCVRDDGTLGEHTCTGCAWGPCN